MAAAQLFGEGGQRGRPPKSSTADSNYSAVARNALGRPDRSKMAR